MSFLCFKSIATCLISCTKVHYQNKPGWIQSVHSRKVITVSGLPSDVTPFNSLIYIRQYIKQSCVFQANCSVGFLVVKLDAITSKVCPVIGYSSAVTPLNSLIMYIRQYCVDQQEFEDTNGVISIGISKKNRQHKSQTKNYKRTTNDLRNIHIKLKIE